MDSGLTSFIKKNVIISFVVTVLYFIIFPFFQAYLTPVFIYLILFFFTTSILIQKILVGIVKKKPKQFISLYLVVMVVKNLIYIIVLISYVFIRHNDAIPFIIAFFILYLIYTLYEIISILPYARASNNDAQ